jgi:hypothetical protein
VPPTTHLDCSNVPLRLRPLFSPKPHETPCSNGILGNWRPVTSRLGFTFQSRGQGQRGEQKSYRLPFDNDLYDLPDAERPPCHRDDNHSYKSVYGRLSWNKPSLETSVPGPLGWVCNGRFR